MSRSPAEAGVRPITDTGRDPTAVATTRPGPRGGRARRTAPRRQGEVPALVREGRDDWSALLARGAAGITQMRHDAGATIFAQGQPADAIFFLLRGKARLSVTTSEGKEAIMASLSTGMFFGEGCLAGQKVRIATATALEECLLTKVDRSAVVRLLHEEPAFAALFTTRLLARIILYEADLIDQMFNSSEQRLARLLLLLSHFGEHSISEPVVAGISQEHLAQMVGTTRPRINVFMNRFRKLGYIDYDNEAGLTVHRGLLTVLRD